MKVDVRVSGSLGKTRILNEPDQLSANMEPVQLRPRLVGLPYLKGCFAEDKVLVIGLDGFVQCCSLSKQDLLIPG